MSRRLQLAVVLVCLSVATAAGQSPFITGQNPGSARNDVNGFFGMQFTVGNQPITVTSLGRIYVNGNSQSHVLKFVQKGQSTNAAGPFFNLVDVPGSAVTVNMVGGIPNNYVYAQLPAAISLQANTTYFLVSQETAGGDKWYDYGTVSHTPDASVDGMVYPYGSGLNVFLSSNYAYVTTNFQYTIARAFVTGQNPGRVRNDASGFFGMEILANSPLAVTSLGRIYLAGNQSSHIVKLVSKTVTSGGTTFGDVPGGQVTITMQPGTPGTYQFVPLPSPVLLLPGNNPNNPGVTTFYYLVSQETAGGDTWYDYGTVQHTADAFVSGLVYPQSVAGGPPYTEYLAEDYAFVPANFQYNVSNSFFSTGISVKITNPLAGQTVSGTYSLQASATPVSPIRPITSVNFYIDSVLAQTYTPNNQTGVVSYQLPYDTTKLGNGVHFFSATATDALNTIASAQVAFYVGNGANIMGDLIPPAPASNLRNDISGYFGYQFTVGSAPVTVYGLGRSFIAGNSRTHIVKLVDAGTGVDVPSGSVSVTMSGPNFAGGGQYVNFPSPLVLPQGHSYYLLSQETAGGDFWYDWGYAKPSADFLVNGLAYGFPSPVFFYASPNYVFGVPNLLYNFGANSGAPLAVTISAPNSPVGTIHDQSPGAQITAIPSGTAISSVQFLVDGVAVVPPLTGPPYLLNLPNLNFGPHTLTVTAMDSHGGTATFGPATFNYVHTPLPQYSSGYQDLNLVNFTPGNLRSNFTGFAGFRFQYVGGALSPIQIGTNAVGIVAVEIGRICAPGNSQVHLVKLVNAADGSDVAGGSAYINMAGCSAGKFVPAQIGATLIPGNAYYLVSYETAGGDQFYDASPAVGLSAIPQALPPQNTPPFTIQMPVFSSGSQWLTLPQMGYSYVGLSLGSLLLVTPI